MSENESPESPERSSGERDTGQRTSPAPEGDGSVTDILGEESGKRFLKYIVGVFVAVAIGYGVGLVLLDGVGDGGASTIGFAALFVPILGAPLISMVTGLLTGLRLNAETKPAALVSAVGAFVGFIVLLFVILFFASIVADGGSNGGGSDGSVGDFFGPLFAFGAGVATTGAGTTYVVKQIDI